MTQPMPCRRDYLTPEEVDWLLRHDGELRQFHEEALTQGFHLRPVKRPVLTLGRPLAFRFRWRCSVDDGQLRREAVMTFTTAFRR